MKYLRDAKMKELNQLDGFLFYRRNCPTLTPLAALHCYQFLGILACSIVELQWVKLNSKDDQMLILYLSYFTVKTCDKQGA